MVKNINEYLNNLTEDQKSNLLKLHKFISSTIPEATERLSSNVPAFYYKSKYLVSISATEKHLNLLVMQGNIINLLSRELKEYNIGKRIIRFSHNQQLPFDLIKKIILLRKEQIDKRS